MPETSLSSTESTHKAYTESRISDKEIEMMAKILIERHGYQAYATAKLFMEEHIETNSKNHAHAWSRVAQYIFENTDMTCSH